MNDLFRIKRHADGAWYVQGARGGECEDVKIVLWAFHDRQCAIAACESLNALVLADAMSACMREEVVA